MRPPLDHSHRMDGQAARRGRRNISREGHGISRRDGSARPFRKAVSALLHAGAAHRAWRARGQLLPCVPDRRPAARRSGTVEAAEGRLAEDTRRARAATAGTGPSRIRSKLRRYGPMASMSGLRSGPSDTGVGDVNHLERRDRLQPPIDLHHHASAADRDVVESGAAGRQRDSRIRDAQVELHKTQTRVPA